MRSIPSVFRSTKHISSSSLTLQASGLCIPVCLLCCFNKIIQKAFITQACLSDLHRYLLYHFPLISALIGVMSNFTFLSLIIALSFLQFNLGRRRLLVKVRCSKMELIYFYALHAANPNHIGSTCNSILLLLILLVLKCIVTATRTMI